MPKVTHLVSGRVAQSDLCRAKSRMQVFLYLVTDTHLTSISNSLNLLETELPSDRYKVVAFSLRGAKPMGSGERGLFAQDFSVHSSDLLALGS